MFDESDIQDRADMLARLLPPGPAWTAGARGDETLPTLLRAFGTELARMAGDVGLLPDAMFPDTTSLLPWWERVLGLAAEGDDDTRRLRVLTKLRGYADPSVPNMQALVDTFVDGATVESRPYQQFRVGDAVGRALRGDAWLSTFVISYPGSPNAALEAAVLEAKPLHTTAEFRHVSF